MSSETLSLTKNEIHKRRFWALLKEAKLNWIAYVFLIPSFAAMSLVVFYPLILGLFYSLTNLNGQNMGSPTIEASYSFIGIENFKSIFDTGYFLEDIKEYGFWQSFKDNIWQNKLFSVLRQTLVWTFANVFFHFLFGLIFALILNQPLKGRGIYRTLLIVPWAVPGFVAAYSWRWLFNNDYGFFNQALRSMGFEGINWLSDPTWAMVSVIMTNVWAGIPFMMMTLLGGLQTIPRNIYEAAEIEGIPRFYQFFYLTLPLLKPVAFTATLLGFIWTFNMFPVIYLITKGGPGDSTQILATFAYNRAFGAENYGEASAYGVIILSILIVLSFFYTKVSKANQN